MSIAYSQAGGPPKLDNHHHHQPETLIGDNSDRQLESAFASMSVMVCLAGQLLGAYFLVSGMMQLCFSVFTAQLCGVDFHQDQDKIAWLVSTCVVVGLSRLLLAFPTSRPIFDPLVHRPIEKGSRLSGLRRGLAFAADVEQHNRDVGVVTKSQMCAGMIHPGFYYRAILISWQEGLISLMTAGLNLIRLYSLLEHFSRGHYEKILKRDADLQLLFEAFGKNSSIDESLGVISELTGFEKHGALIRIQGLDLVYRLARHDCQIVSFMAGRLFIAEDIAALLIIAVSCSIPFVINCLTFRSNMSGAASGNNYKV